MATITRAEKVEVLKSLTIETFGLTMRFESYGRGEVFVDVTVVNAPAPDANPTTVNRMVKLAPEQAKAIEQLLRGGRIEYSVTETLAKAFPTAAVPA